MYYILYNDRSNRGKPIWIARKLVRKLKRKKINFQLISFLELNGQIKEFHNNLSNQDCVYLVGGDGTFHYYLNHVFPEYISYRIFIVASGRGNDLARDYKKHKPFEITHLVNDLPTITINVGEKNPFLECLAYNPLSGVQGTTLRTAGIWMVPELWEMTFPISVAS